MKRRRKPRPLPFAGLTPVDCCTGCVPGRCLISAKPYCGHPRKGGLSSTEMSNRAASARLIEAERLLGSSRA